MLYLVASAIISYSTPIIPSPERPRDEFCQQYVMKECTDLELVISDSDLDISFNLPRQPKYFASVSPRVNFRRTPASVSNSRDGRFKRVPDKKNAKRAKIRKHYS